MPDTDPNPPKPLKPVITPWRCKHCKRQFNHMHILKIADVDHLMIGTAKVFRIEVVCTDCGTVNYWNQREQEMTAQTQVLLELLAALTVSANQITP